MGRPLRLQRLWRSPDMRRGSPRIPVARLVHKIDHRGAPLSEHLGKPRLGPRQMAQCIICAVLLVLIRLGFHSIDDQLSVRMTKSLIYILSSRPQLASSVAWTVHFISRPEK